MLPAQLCTLKAAGKANSSALAVLWGSSPAPAFIPKTPQAPQAACLEPCMDPERGLCYSSGVHEWEAGVHGAAEE